MRILIEEGVQVHPVSTVSQCLKIIFGVGKEELVPKIRERVGTAATLTQLA